MAIDTPDEYDAGDLEAQLSACVRYFEEAEDSSSESRRLAERDRAYVDNEQWTAEEMAILRKRKQPILTVNKIKQKVEFLKGFERRVRSDPKAFPRNPDDEQGAEAATDSLRFVADQNDYDQKRSDVYENMLVEGTGGVDVVAEEMPNGDVKIVYKRVPWDRLFWDPHSAEKDFSDKKYCGIVIWKDTSDAIDEYPDARDAIENTLSTTSASDTYDDRPRNQIWCDSRRKRVRIVQIQYHWRGEWMIATFTKGGFLVEPQVSPYIDKDGRSACSLIMRSMYIDQENQRYGDVRSLISLQDEVNKRRSKALHLLSVRQTFGNQQGVKDTQKTKTELAKPDGHVELNGGAVFGQDFGVIPTGDLAQGQIALMQQSLAEMQAQGPNNALAGKGTESQSGRAIQAQQQGGAVEIEPGLDGLRQFSRDIYEATWMRIKQFWTAEKWVRVTDDERNLKWVGLNKPVTLGEKLSQLPPEEQQMYAQQMGLTPGDPRLQEVIEVENDVNGLDVDIVVEEGPDISTLQSEQFEMLSNLAKAGIGIPPKAIIQASSIRNKEAILDEMEKGVQLPPEVQKQMQEMQQALQAAQQKEQEQAQQLAKLQLQLQDKQGDLQIKAGALQLQSRALDIKEGELQVRQFEAMRPDATQSPEQPDPLMQLDAAQKLADIEGTQADTEQTQVETLLMLQPQPQVEETAP